MYSVLIILLLCMAVGSILWGFYRKKMAGVVLGVVIGVAIFLFFNVMSFWSDMLWFDSLGYLDHFWKVILYRVLFAVAGGIIGFGLLWILTLFVFDRKKTRIRWIPALTGLYIGAKWASLNWDTILLFIKGPMTGTTDPTLNKDIGFYLFNLPFYEELYAVLFGFCIVALISVFAGIFLTFKNGRIDFKNPRLSSNRHDRRINWLYLNIVLFLSVLAWGRYLDRFQQMDSQYKAVLRGGWSDVKISLPALNILIVILAAGFC